jgi:hypothetical protein
LNFRDLKPDFAAENPVLLKNSYEIKGVMNQRTKKSSSRGTVEANDVGIEF